MYIIKNGRIHIGNGTVLEKSDILINGTRIEKVAENIACEVGEVIDASGKEVFPGFITRPSAQWEFQAVIWILMRYLVR